MTPKCEDATGDRQASLPRRYNVTVEEIPDEGELSSTVFQCDNYNRHALAPTHNNPSEISDVPSVKPEPGRSFTVPCQSNTNPPSTIPKMKRERSPSVIVITSDSEEDKKPPHPSRCAARRLKRQRLQCSPSVITISSDSDSDTKPFASAHLSRESQPRSPSALPEISDVVSRSCRTNETPSEHHHIQSTELRIGEEYPSLEGAIQAILEDAEKHGFVLRRGQRVWDDAGTKKVTLRCQCYQSLVETHNPRVHPADHRHGRTNRSNCFAHTNANRVPQSTKYYISLLDLSHNHPSTLPSGGRARRAPSQAQRDLAS